MHHEWHELLGLQLLFTAISIVAVGPDWRVLKGREAWATWIATVSVLCWAAMALRELGFYAEIPARAGADASALSVDW